jgi:hypothetical protein
MRTMVSSPELSEIKLRTLVNAHLADVSLHSLQELLSQEEKQLKLILSLSLRLQTFNMKSYIHNIAS